MDGVSAAASAVAIIELTGKAVLFLSSIKHAPKDRKMCAIEASNLLKLLVDLRFRLEEAQPHEPWYTAVRTLAVENGPFDQYKQALEKLQSKITEGHFLKKLGDALVWPLVKEDVADITSRMERLKTFVLIALENDHMYVFVQRSRDRRTNVTLGNCPEQSKTTRPVSAIQLWH